MHSRVITVTGPSMSGKTTALEMMLESNLIPCEIVPKYKTRAERSDDGVEVISCEEIPKECDVVYQHAGTHYGFESKLIYDALRRGATPIVILSDIRAIEDLRSMLGPLVTSLFVFRNEPKEVDMIAIAQKRGVDDYEDTRNRLKKAQSTYRIYIENIEIFDHVIINSGTLDDLEQQVFKIIDSIKDNTHVRPFSLSQKVT